MAETGQTQYSDVAASLGFSTEEGRRIVHDLVEAVPSGIRLDPATDWIATLTPFTIAVEGPAKMVWHLRSGRAGFRYYCRILTTEHENGIVTASYRTAPAPRV